MIDERHEELAALHAFDLLEGSERAQFEAELARNPELQALVRSLRDASASLAHASTTPPPPELKQRVLASVAPRTSASAGAPSDNVIRPPVSLFRSPRISWAAAACFALLAAWLGQRFVTARSELAQLRRQNEAADIVLQSTRQQLEADRIINRRQLQELDQQRSVAVTQLEVERN